MRSGDMLEGQVLHAAALALLLGGVTWAAGTPHLAVGAFAGLSARAWLWVAVAVPVLHQVYVWACWRAELHGRALSRVLGARAFALYSVGFAVLGMGRVLAALAAGLANQGTLPGDPWMFGGAGLLVFLPAAYLIYSVKRYFTFRRALGIDHFDAAARSAPMVRGGIFRFTSNGMYVFGFLLFWALALWTQSVSALVVAAFNHAYIWVHFFATERPDMRRIYGHPAATV